MLPKDSPLETLPALLRVLLKALIVALAINFGLLAAGIKPVRALVQLNTYDLIGQGRARLAYPSDFQNGQLPVEALIAAHEISQPTQPGTSRAVLLGESGIAGWGLHDEETLSAQISTLNIDYQTSALRAYNLAYPQPGALRDLLIMDAVLAEDVDLIIWFVNPTAVYQDRDLAGANRVFYGLNENRLRRLVEQYPDLRPWFDEIGQGLLPESQAWEQYAALRDTELLPVWFNSLFYPWLEPDLAAFSRRVAQESVAEEAQFQDADPGFAEMPGPAWQALRVGCRMSETSGARLMLVNGPMLIVDEAVSARNYNSLYERALVDRYRAVMAEFTTQHDIWYLDLWDAIPAESFTDTPQHADAEGWAQLAQRLESAIRVGSESRCR